MPKKIAIASSRSGEKGMALILAIALLGILSILGAVVMEVSTRDLGQSATFMPARQAFYTADRAVEYAMNRDIIISLSPGETVNLMNDDAISPGTLTHKQIIEADATGTLNSGSITDLGVNELPPSVAAMYGSEFGANFYHVEVKTSAPANAQSHVNASIIRLFKSDDDTIFRTSGGG